MRPKASRLSNNGVGDGAAGDGGAGNGPTGYSDIREWSIWLVKATLFVMPPEAGGVET